MKLHETHRRDISNSHEAEQARMAVISYLETLNPKSGVNFILLGRFSKKWNNIGIHFDTTKDIEEDAEIATYLDMKGMPKGKTWIISFGCRFHETAADAIEIITREASTFRHEFIHYIDSRSGKKIGKNYKMEEYYNNMTPEELKDFTKRYCNDPSEMNAYAHEMMEPLLDLLRKAKDGDYREIEHAHIEPEFTKYFTDLISNFDEMNLMVWKYWSPEAKKVFLKRLQNLHKAVLAIQRSKKDKPTVMGILRALVDRIKN